MLKSYIKKGPEILRNRSVDIILPQGILSRCEEDLIEPSFKTRSRGRLQFFEKDSLGNQQCRTSERVAHYRADREYPLSRNTEPIGSLEQMPSRLPRSTDQKCPIQFLNKTKISYKGGQLMPYIYHKRVRWDNKINLGVNQSVHKLELYKLDPGIYRAFMNSAKPFLPHLILDIYIMLRAPDTRYTYVIMVLINK